jgi:YhcH/YjgK/YiaL family protein
MIVDVISSPTSFVHLPWFSKVSEFLASHDLATCEPGRYDLDGDQCFVIVADDVQRDEVAPLEAHRAYIDVQIALRGSFDIMWTPRASCMHVAKEFDVEADIEFFSDVPATRIHVAEGTAVVLYPDDAHAPQPPSVAVRKCIFKVHTSYMQ